MIITLETKSGSIYKVCEREGKVFISKGASFEAEITRLKRPIKMGEVLEAELRKYDMYLRPHTEPSYIKTTQIVALEITI